MSTDTRERRKRRGPERRQSISLEQQRRAETGRIERQAQFWNTIVQQVEAGRSAVEALPNESAKKLFTAAQTQLAKQQNELALLSQSLTTAPTPDEFHAARGEANQTISVLHQTAELLRAFVQLPDSLWPAPVPADETRVRDLLGASFATDQLLVKTTITKTPTSDRPAAPDIHIVTGDRVQGIHVDGGMVFFDTVLHQTSRRAVIEAIKTGKSVAQSTADTDAVLNTALDSLDGLLNASRLSYVDQDNFLSRVAPNLEHPPEPPAPPVPPTPEEVAAARARKIEAIRQDNFKFAAETLLAQEDEPSLDDIFALLARFFPGQDFAPTPVTDTATAVTHNYLPATAQRKIFFDFDLRGTLSTVLATPKSSVSSPTHPSRRGASPAKASLKTGKISTTQNILLRKQSVITGVTAQGIRISMGNFPGPTTDSTIISFRHFLQCINGSATGQSLQEAWRPRLAPLPPDAAMPVSERPPAAERQPNQPLIAVVQEEPEIEPHPLMTWQEFRVAAGIPEHYLPDPHEEYSPPLTEAAFGALTTRAAQMEAIEQIARWKQWIELTRHTPMWFRKNTEIFLRGLQLGGSGPIEDRLDKAVVGRNEQVEETWGALAHIIPPGLPPTYFDTLLPAPDQLPLLSDDDFETRLEQLLTTVPDGVDPQWVKLAAEARWQLYKHRVGIERTKKMFSGNSLETTKRWAYRVAKLAALFLPDALSDLFMGRLPNSSYGMSTYLMQQLERRGLQWPDDYLGPSQDFFQSLTELVSRSGLYFEGRSDYPLIIHPTILTHSGDASLSSQVSIHFPKQVPPAVSEAYRLSSGNYLSFSEDDFLKFLDQFDWKHQVGGQIRSAVGAQLPRLAPPVDSFTLRKPPAAPITELPAPQTDTTGKDLFSRLRSRYTDSSVQLGTKGGSPVDTLSSLSSNPFSRAAYADEAQSAAGEGSEGTADDSTRNAVNEEELLLLTPPTEGLAFDADPLNPFDRNWWNALGDDEKKLVHAFIIKNRGSRVLPQQWNDLVYRSGIGEVHVQPKPSFSMFANRISVTDDRFPEKDIPIAQFLKQIENGMYMNPNFPDIAGT